MHFICEFMCMSPLLTLLQLQNCKAVVFLLDERSALSVYCHDEVS